MPKKTIHPPREDSPFALAVSWGRDRDLQVGIQVVDPDRSVVDVLFGGEHGYLDQIGELVVWRLEQAGYELTKIAHEPQDEAAVTPAGLGQLVLHALNTAREHIERDGLWAEVDRRGANDAVRALRAGRDSAFGKDA